jgi:hypothetical protein
MLNKTYNVEIKLKVQFGIIMQGSSTIHIVAFASLKFSIQIIMYKHQQRMMFTMQLSNGMADNLGDAYRREARSSQQ